MAVSLVSTGVQFPDSTIQTTAATAGGVNLLTTVTGTAASNMVIDSVFTSTYDYYDVVITGTVSTSATLCLRFYLGGVITSSATYQNKNITNNSLSTEDGVTYLQLGFINAGASKNNFTYTFRIVNPTLTTTTKLIYYLGGIYRSDLPFIISGVATNTGTSALTGLFLFPDAGTFTATARVYGYAK